MHKFSYTTMASPDWDGKTAIQQARANGFQGVDLRISDHLGELKENSTSAEIKELKKIFKEEGIVSSSLLAYNAQVTADPVSWDKMERSVLKNLDIGTQLGTKLVRIFLGNPDSTNDHEGFIGHAAEVLAGILRKDRSATSIIIQNHTGGVGIHDIFNIMKLVKEPRLNLVLCPANAFCMKENFDDVISFLKDSLPQLYIADLVHGEEFKDGHKNSLPGEGDIDFKKVYAGLGGDSFKGWISFKWEKIWNPEIPGPETALPYFIKYIKELTEKTK